MKKVLCIFALVMFVFTGCGKTVSTEARILNDKDEVGEGATTFELEIVDDTEKEIHVTVHTDEETVGDALEELHIISGKKDSYGLYVMTVNGQTVDYEEDHMYWAFYINDEYAEESISATEITPDFVYTLKVEEA